MNLKYLDEVKRRYLVDDEGLIDIVEIIAGVARDNSADDEFLLDLASELEKKKEEREHGEIWKNKKLFAGKN